MNVPTASETPEVLLIAAEASSELYGRRIIEEARRRALPVSFYGIGSLAMTEMGFDLVEKYENMAVVGLWEVMAHWSVIKSAFQRLVSRTEKKKPAAALLMDYPGFNLRLAKKLHNSGIPVLYFISPQVWAWKTGRVHLIKKIVSRMLVVFPFEKKFYEDFNVPVRFVGHPLLDELKDSAIDAEHRRVAREQLGIGDNDFLVGLLPGSRDSELKHNFLPQLQAAVEIHKQRAQARFLILVAPTFEKDHLAKLIPAGLNVELQLVKDDPLKILQLCDACLVASGTATLMTALAGTPMVIMYRMNAMTGFMARRMVSGRFFGMVNLILGERAVPELFQQDASPEKMAAEIIKFIDDQDLVKVVKAKLAKVKSLLGNGGAIEKVVDNLSELIAAGRAPGASR